MASPGPALAERMIVDKSDFLALVSDLGQCREFAFDTEFVGEDTYIPVLCLIQVATRDALYLVDPIAIQDVTPFWKLVADPANTVIVHGGREEVRLCRQWSGNPPGNLIDLQITAGMLGMGFPTGMASLVQTVLGHRLSKSETLTEWRARPLTLAQRNYAYDDVRYLLEINDRLNARLAELDRLEWAREEHARFVELTDPEIIAGREERWRKVKGSSQLDRRQLCLLRALHAWRETRAHEANRPVRTVMRDDLLVEISRRHPGRPGDLQMVRGLSKKDIDGILATVEAADAIPEDQWPEVLERDSEATHVQALSGLLQTVFMAMCAEMKLAPGLTCTMGEIRDLLRCRLTGPAEPTEGLLITGWRRKHVLPRLLAVLDGRVAFRLNLESDKHLTWFEVNGQ
ncbi:MAG: HRDC domain-containing protein [Planctomycetota bacterium]|nr:HRDC domain-containing protein [Planctomycetota bacterium]